MDESGTVLSKGPCPDCGSKDNLALYSDGHSYCYTPGCGLKNGKRDMDDIPERTQAALSKEFVPFSSGTGLKTRRLKQDTLTRFGYFVHDKGGESFHIAPYYNQKGELAHQKYRNKDKEFFFQPVIDNAPRPKQCQMFGQQVWGNKNDRKVVITEGELDMLSVAQATQFKIPVVSIPNGTGSALDAIKANYRWLDRFQEVILWMDNDEPGQSVIAECANLFEPGKVKVIRVPGFKDASEMLQAGKDGDVYGAVWGATVWAPQGIINAALCAADLDQEEGEVVGTYPWPLVQEHTLGIRTGEVVYHVAGTGIGKTTMIVEMQHSLLEQGVKFGVIRFEDSRRKSQLDLMSIRAGRRLHLNPLPKDEQTALHSQVFDGGLVELFDPENALWDFDSILGYIRYMAKALGCKVIFIDPLTFLVASIQALDERRALDKIAYDFARTVKQMGVNLQVTHHLTRPQTGRAHEEGGEISINQIRGSGGIANFSMTIIGYERDQQGPRPDLTRARLVKNRFVGWTGIADVLQWVEATGRQVPTSEEYPTRDKDGAPSFGPAEDY